MTRIIEIRMKDVPEDVENGMENEMPCGGIVMDLRSLADGIPSEEMTLRPFDLIVRCPDPYLAMDIAELVQSFIDLDPDYATEPEPREGI